MLPMNFELYSIVQQQGIPAAVDTLSMPQYGAYDSNDNFQL